MPNANDGRRLEVVVDGLPLFGGRQLAIDTSLVGALHADGTARVRAANRDGVALLVALAADVVWSCWEVKWEAGGLLKHEVF